ncbi:unnamed protein product, partial [Didymodactylos carnosus]
RNIITNTLNISPCATRNKNGTTIAGNPNGSEGSDLSSLKGPRGILVDLGDSNTLYVVDEGNKRILKFKQGEINGQAVAENLTRPVGVFIDNDKNLYVGHSGKVLKFRPNTSVGVIVAGGNGVGSGLHQLSIHTPGLMIDQNNNLYVSEHENHRIVKWEPSAQTGILIAGKTNSRGKNSIRLNFPQGIVVDSIHNALYVTDCVNYTAGGVCIAGRCESGGRQPHELRASFDLKFDSDRNLIVSQTNNIQKFEIIRNQCN